MVRVILLFFFQSYPFRLSIRLVCSAQNSPVPSCYTYNKTERPYHHLWDALWYGPCYFLQGELHLCLWIFAPAVLSTGSLLFSQTGSPQHFLLLLKVISSNSSGSFPTCCIQISRTSLHKESLSQSLPSFPSLIPLALHCVFIVNLELSPLKRSELSIITHWICH